MKKIIFFLLPALLLPCTAKELIIAEKNCNSAWQIVVPEPVGNKALDDYVALGGKVHNMGGFEVSKNTVKRSLIANISLLKTVTL